MTTLAVLIVAGFAGMLSEALEHRRPVLGFVSMSPTLAGLGYCFVTANQFIVEADTVRKFCAVTFIICLGLAATPWFAYWRAKYRTQILEKSVDEVVSASGSVSCGDVVISQGQW